MGLTPDAALRAVSSLGLAWLAVGLDIQLITSHQPNVKLLNGRLPLSRSQQSS
jgi:hypothetical protein